MRHDHNTCSYCEEEKVIFHRYLVSNDSKKEVEISK